MQTRWCSWAAVITLPVWLPACGEETGNGGSGVAGGGAAGAPASGGDTNPGGGANGQGGATGQGGSGGAADICTINSVVYPSGTLHPTNRCLFCDPSISTVAWNTVADGTACDPGKVCDTGVCLAKCAIDATLYDDGAENPDNLCQVCRPATSTTAWSNGAEAIVCGTDQACHEGTCQAACVINATYYVPGAPNPNNPCQSCQPSQSQTKTTWSEVPTARCTTAIGLGLGHSCAVVGGGVLCWGLNGYGQLGNDSTTFSRIPVRPRGLTSGATAVAGGGHHSCAVVGGAVFCWGANGSGQLGDGSTKDSLVPVQVQGLPSGIKNVACGADHTCAGVNHDVYCWGANRYAQLGNNSTVDSPVPVQVQAREGGYAGWLAAGGDFSCVSGSYGYCWGRNAHGQLGNDTTAPSAVPVQVINMHIMGRMISGGPSHACAVVDNVPICWGANESGQLGDGTTIDRPRPVGPKIEYLSDPGGEDIAAGYFHSCVVSMGGVQCWGQNSHGQLGNASTTDSLVPVVVIRLRPVLSAPWPVTAVGAGMAHSCALVNGGVQCWGMGAWGQLGNDSLLDSTVPVQVLIP